MKSANLSPKSILVPDDVERAVDRVADDLLLKSIEKGGIQQPLVLVDVDGKHILIDGLRRLRVAHHLGLSRIPVVIDTLPNGHDVDAYRRKIRFLLDTHRQDLLPSQKAELIETLKRMFGMTYRQVAAYLGVSDDAVTNFTQVTQFIPAVVAALDSGALSAQKSRVFVGLSEPGQEAIWKAHKRELTAPGHGDIHKELRARYSPQAFPKYYKDPELVASRLARKGGERKTKKRPAALSASEKSRLLNSMGAKETELRDAQADLKMLKAEIAAATPIVHAILRDPKLKALVPADMVAELERFGEIF